MNKNTGLLLLAGAVIAGIVMSQKKTTVQRIPTQPTKVVTLPGGQTVVVAPEQTQARD